MVLNTQGIEMMEDMLRRMKCGDVRNISIFAMSDEHGSLNFMSGFGQPRDKFLLMGMMEAYKSVMCSQIGFHPVEKK